MLGTLVIHVTCFTSYDLPRYGDAQTLSSSEYIEDSVSHISTSKTSFLFNADKSEEYKGSFYIQRKQ